MLWTRHQEFIELTMAFFLIFYYMYLFHAWRGHMLCEIEETIGSTGAGVTEVLS